MVLGLPPAVKLGVRNRIAYMWGHQYGVVLAGIFAFGFFYYLVEGCEGINVVEAVKDSRLRDPCKSYWDLLMRR